MKASELIEALENLLRHYGDLEVKGTFMIPHSSRFGDVSVVLSSSENYATPKDHPKRVTKHFNVGLVDFNKGISDGQA